MRRQTLATVLAGALLVSGCATAPLQHEVDRTRTYDQTKDVIWERAVAFFAAHNLSIKTIEKASGIIAVDREITVPIVGLEGYADCGTDPLMRNIAQSIDLNLFVRALPDGRSTVSVNTRFTETRIYGFNMLTARTVTCVSTGKLEDDMLSTLYKAL